MTRLPNVRLALSVSLVLFLAACGTSGGDIGSGADPLPATLRTLTGSSDATDPTWAAAGIFDVDAALGSSFAIGGTDFTLSGQTAANEAVRFSSGSEPRTHRLVLQMIL